MEADKIEMGMHVQLRGTVDAFCKGSPFIILHVQSADIEPAYYDVPYYYLEPAPRERKIRLGKLEILTFIQENATEIEGLNHRCFGNEHELFCRLELLFDRWYATRRKRART